MNGVISAEDCFGVLKAVAMSCKELVLHPNVMSCGKAGGHPLILPKSMSLMVDHSSLESPNWKDEWSNK